MEDATLLKLANTDYVLRSIRDGHEYRLGDQLLVGREADCSLTLPEQHISRYHAKLVVAPNGVWVEDLNSSNGTFINGNRITKRHLLNIGDEVAFHETRFRLTTSKSGGAEATMIETPDGRRLYEPAVKLAEQITTTKPEITSIVSSTRSVKPINGEANQSTLSEPSEAEQEGTRMLSSTELSNLAERSRAARATPLNDSGAGPRLVVMTAPLRGKVIPLLQPLPDNTWRIGRARSADIQLEDRTVSLDHARLSKTAGGWLLSSTHARNGLQVNGAATQRAFVKHNDRIRFGRMEVCLKLETSPPHDHLAPDQETTLSHHPYRLASLVGIILCCGALLLFLAAR